MASILDHPMTFRAAEQVACGVCGKQATNGYDDPAEPGRPAHWLCAEHYHERYPGDKWCEVCKAYYPHDRAYTVNGMELCEGHGAIVQLLTAHDPMTEENLWHAMRGCYWDIETKLRTLANAGIILKSGDRWQMAVSNE